MTDEFDALMARARRLEEENSMLRSMQSPSGPDDGLRAENAMLRSELGAIRSSAGPVPPAPGEAETPETLQEFNALPPAQRQAVARRMTRQQRDEVLGRQSSKEGRESYL